MPAAKKGSRTRKSPKKSRSRSKSPEQKKAEVALVKAIRKVRSASAKARTSVKRKANDCKRKCDVKYGLSPARAKRSGGTWLAHLAKLRREGVLASMKGLKVGSAAQVAINKANMALAKASYKK